MRTIEVTGTSENQKPCPKSRSLSGSDRRITLGFEDYPEVDINVADCLDPSVVITAQVNR
jgi:hypothetical protein